MNLADQMTVSVDNVNLTNLAGALCAFADLMDRSVVDDDDTNSVPGLLHANYLLTLLLDGYVKAQDEASVKRPKKEIPQIQAAEAQS